MTLLLGESFRGASAGTTLSTSNTGFSSYSGAATGTFAADTAVLDTCGAKFAYGAANNLYGEFVHAAKTTAFLRMFCRVSAAPTTAYAFAAIVSTATYRAQLAFSATARIILRQGTTANFTGTVNYAGKWMRLEWDLAAAAQTLRIFTADNLFGDVPDETYTGAINTGGWDRLRVGAITAPGSTGAFFLDELAYDDAATPGAVGEDGWGMAA